MKKLKKLSAFQALEVKDDNMMRYGQIRKHLLLLLLLAWSATAVWAQTDVNGNAIDMTGTKGYWVRNVQAKQLNLSTKLPSVEHYGKSDWWPNMVRIYTADFTDLSQVFYFITVDGKSYMFTKDASGNRTFVGGYSADATRSVTYEVNANGVGAGTTNVSCNNKWHTRTQTTGPTALPSGIGYLKSIDAVANTNNVHLTIAKNDAGTVNDNGHLLAHTGFGDECAVSNDGSTSRDPYTQWMLIPYEPKNYLKEEIDDVTALLAGAEVEAGGAYTKVKAQSYKDDLQAVLDAANTVYAKASPTTAEIQTAWKNLLAAKETFLTEAYNAVTDGTYYVRNSANNALLNFTTDNAQATAVGSATGADQLVSFETDGTYYYIKCNGRYLQRNQDKYTSDYKLQLVQTQWTTSNRPAKGRFQLRHIDNEHIGFYLVDAGKGTVYNIDFSYNGFLYVDNRQAAAPYNLLIGNLNGTERVDKLNPTARWTLEPFTPTEFTYHVINHQNQEVAKYAVPLSSSLLEETVIELPDQLKSALVSGYKYYKTAADLSSGTNQLASGATLSALGDSTDIYVSYDVNDIADFPELSVDGSTELNMMLNGRYITDNSGVPAITNLLPDATNKDIYLWKMNIAAIAGGGYDPYDVTITSKDGNALRAAKHTTSSNNLTFSADGTQLRWMLLSGANDHSYRLTQANIGNDANYIYSLYRNGNNVRLISNDKVDGLSSRLSNADVQVTFQQSSAINRMQYTIVTNDGSIYSNVETDLTATLSLPEAARSPLAKNYRYYTSLDDATTDSKANCVYDNGALTTDVYRYYVRYDYNADNTVADGHELKIDGSVQYTLVNGYYGKAYSWDGSTQSLESKTVGKITFDVLPGTLTDNYIWTITGDDPYKMTIVNVGQGNGYYFAPRDNDNNAFYTWSTKEGKKWATWALLTGNKLVTNGYEETKDGNTKYSHKYTSNGSSTAGNADGIVTNCKNACGFILAPYTSTQHAVTYKLYDKNHALIYDITGRADASDKPSLPAKYKSPLVTTWHYWQNSNFTGELETVGDNTTIYVTYEYDAATSVLDLTGRTSYVWSIEHSGQRFFYGSTTVTNRIYSKLSPTDQDKVSPYYHWRFTGDDPYRVQIHCDAYPTYTLSTEKARQNKDQTNNLYLRETAQNQNTFMVMQTVEGCYELAVSGDVCANDNTLWYYISCTAGDNPYVYANAARQAGAYNIQMTLTPYRTYHIIDNQGDEAIYAYTDWSETVSVPTAIKSPLLEPSQYRYYGTLSDAQANNDSKISNGYHFGDVYVRYDYNNETSPIDLNATTPYNWSISNNGDRYLYGNSNVNNRSYSNVSPTLTGLSSAYYRWHFVGEDPYRVQVVCEAYPDYILSTGAAAQNYNSENWLYLRNPAQNLNRFILLQSQANTYEFVVAGQRCVNNLAYQYYIVQNTGDGARVRATSNEQAGAVNVQSTLTPLTCYRIIDNQGDEAMYLYSARTTGLAVPEAIKSPLIVNDSQYRFYGSLSDAQGDNNRLAAMPAHGDIYIRYDYDNSSSPLDLSGKTLYHWSISNNGDRFIYGNATVTNRVYCRSNPSESQLISDYHLWQLTGDDPYRVQFVCAAYPDYILSTQNVAMTSNGANALFLRNPAQNQNTFVMLTGLDGKYEIAAAGGPRSNDESLWYYVTNNGGDYPYVCSHTNYQHGSTYIQSTLTPLYILTYNVVNSSGTVVLDMRSNNSGETLVIPDVLKTPYLPDNSSYAYFNDQSDAQRYVKGQQTLQAPVTTVNQLTGRNVYVGYHYDNAAKAAAQLKGLPVLDGSVTYRIKGTNTGGAVRYYYTNDSYKVRPFNNIGMLASATLGDDADGRYRWQLTGNDPYGVVVTNMWTDKHVYVSPAGLYGANAESWGMDFELSTTNSLPMAFLNNTEGFYELVVVRQQYGTTMTPYGKKAHILFWSSDATNTRGQIVNSQQAADDNPLYVGSTNLYSRLTFEKVDDLHPFEYIIIDNKGNEIVSQTAYRNTGKAPVVPDEIRSPLATSWRFYTDLETAKTDASLTAATPYVDHTQEGNVTTLTNEMSKLYVRYSASDTYDLVGPEYDESSGKRKNDDPQSYLIEFQYGSKPYEEGNFEGKGDKILIGDRYATNNGKLYAHCNGLSQFYVYNEDSKNNYFQTGNNARSRELWYLRGGDPYRLRIISYQTGSSATVNSISTTTYNYFYSAYGTVKGGATALRTSLIPTYDKATASAPSSNGATTPQPHVGTEYMVLASGTGLKLVTSDPLYNPNDAMNPFTSLEERTVNTLEHSWKDSPTVLGDDKTGQPALTDAEKELVGVYQAAGYERNVPTTGSYYSTVDVGETFLLVAQRMVPALHLIDRHGWQIKSWTTPANRANPTASAADRIIVQATNKSNSPMVKRYIWYQENATVGTGSSVSKENGYYKYRIGEDATPIHYSTSLTDYPVTSSTQDFYVTYEVDPVFESGEISYLIEQNGKLATRTVSGLEDELTLYDADPAASTVYTRVADTSNRIMTPRDISFTTRPAENQLWKLERNVDIDVEMGYDYGGETNGEKTREELEATYEENGQNGFDPYNIWVRSPLSGKYLVGLYADGNVQTGEGSTELRYNPSAQITRESMSHSMMQITGATFMAVTDNNNNLRLIQRFEDDEVNSTTGEKNREGYCLGNLSQIVRANNDTEDDQHQQNTYITPTLQQKLHIVNKSGNVAINYDNVFVVSDAVGSDLPMAIHSPFVTNLKFYDTADLTHQVEEPGDGEYWVTYDYDPATDDELNLTQRKYYNLVSINGNQYVYEDAANSHAITTTASDTNMRTDSYLWSPKATLVGEEYDPYQIVLTSRSEGGESVIVPGTFILVPGAVDGQYLLLKSDADAYEPDYDYLKQSGTTMSIADGPATGNAYQVKFVPVPIDVTYAVINLSNRQSIRHTVQQEAGELPRLPKEIKSALVSYDDFTYWHRAKVTRGGEGGEAGYDPTLDNNYAKGSTSGHDGSPTYDLSAATEYTDLLPYSANETIYVTYTFDNATSPIDLSGTSKYNMMVGDDNVTVGEYNVMKGGYYLNSSASWVVNFSTTAPDAASLRTDNYMMKLYPGSGGGQPNSTTAKAYSAPDPYDVRIACLGKNSYMCTRSDNELDTENKYDVYRYGRVDPGKAGENEADYDKEKNVVRSYIIMDGAVEGTYQLMATYRTAVKSSANPHFFYVGTNAANEALKFLNDTQREGNNVKLNFTFVPKDLVNVQYWMNRHIVDEPGVYKQIAEQKDVACNNAIALPDAWQRKYCTYTYYTRFESGDVVSDEFEDGIDKSTYSEAKNAHEDGYVATVYPLVTNRNGTTPTIRVYVDYEVDGLPFNLLADTKAGVDKLLTNADSIICKRFFDITADDDHTTYDKMTTQIADMNGTERERKDFLYFMVLGTNNALTAGDQHFLRRESTGRISTLPTGNVYKLHKDPAKNRNQWSYSRCAEAYKLSDHTPFEEKNWLFAFAGDPYDLFIYNASAIDEDAYNLKTQKVRTKAYHAQHTVDLTTLTNTAGTLTEYVPITPALDDDTPPAQYGWGLAESTGAESDNTFSLTASGLLPDATNGEQLLWQYSKSTIDNQNEVVLKARAANYTNLNYNITVLPYEPQRYEDLNITIRRNDEVATYKDMPEDTDEQKKAKETYLQGMQTGVSKLFFAADERLYMVGDEIDMSDLSTIPQSVRRAFCNYTLYKSEAPFDEIAAAGTKYTIKEGPYPTKVQATTDGYWETDGAGNYVKDSNGNYVYNPNSGYKVTDEDGKPVWTYLDKDGKPAPLGAQTIYASYEVTSDIFLKTAPGKTEVEKMVANNDHVYFMDFPTTGTTAHHAFYISDADSRIQTGDLSKKLDKNTGTWRTERRKWNNGTKKWEDDMSDAYNRLQYRTADDRMKSVPNNLKWYFVGDPYHVQVFNCAGDWNEAALTDKDNNVKAPAYTKQAQLARFNTVQTNFQFMVDCVQLRLPDYTAIDERANLTLYDETGKVLAGDPIPNRNVGKPYYNDFYWEVVPAMSNEDGTFALRFKEDNDLLGYRNVYYYLAHDGLTKQYVTEGESDKQTYHINLSYDPDNAVQTTNKDYIGYHKANNANTVVKLVQPVKVLVNAFGAVASGAEASENAKSAHTLESLTRKTTNEVSEYYGLGETLTAVPRHLQRKYVKYGAMNYELTPANASSIGECTVTGPTNPVHPVSFAKLDSDRNAVTTYKNAVFTFNVSYSMDDVTAEGVHLFSTCADASNPQASELTWLDVMIGSNNWLYYDKTNTDDASGVENQTTKVSNYRRAVSNNKTSGWNNSADGWNDGLKGLHWAFIGDPYDFTILNRRRYEDNAAAGTSSTGNQWLKSDNNLVMTSTGNADATHYALRMWKTGGASDFVLANESGATKDATLRMVAQQKDGSEFRFIDHDLEDHRVYTGNINDLNYNNYYNNDYHYDSTLSGLGGANQWLQIRTAVAKDEDKADNDCFDSEVRIYTNTGILRIQKKGMEIKYGKAADMLPYSLRRYGCTYQCYLVTVNAEGEKVDSMLIDNFDSDSRLTGLSGYPANGEPTFREFIASKKAFHLSYVYTMTDEAAQFFTTASDAITDDYTWMNTNFAWDQKYSGTNVEIEYYEKVFDHYVYNADGKIIDEVYRLERRTKVVGGGDQAYPTTAYLNSHTNQSSIYADEGAQSESDRQKWALVGDPYSFNMKNYEQYLDNEKAALMLDGSTVSSSNIPSQASNFAITVDKNGKTYLTVIGPDGEPITSITFDFSTTSDKVLTKQGVGVNQNDPTGNTLDTNNVKPFQLANLIRYADLLQYHLVIAHQHSLDHEDNFGEVTESDRKNYSGKSDDDILKIKKAQEATLNEHLLEYLKYQGIRKNEPTMYVNADATVWHTAQESNIKTLLKQNGTLRDFISYPIADYSVSRVGIGNHPQVPWYMQRQFCRYYLYQKDVERSQPNPNDPLIVVKDGKNCYVWVNETENLRDTLVISNTTHATDSKWYKALNVTWVSVRDMAYWTQKDAPGDSIVTVTAADVHTWDPDGTKGLAEGQYRKIPKLYNEVVNLNGKVLDKLQECHYNRKVLIDVVYEVIPEEFKFSDKGRNTTAWYQMMTNNEADGLMNFTYREGIGARMDRTEHYTNNYLWAPEGDPYGFVLRSRYATINGTGWDDVVVTTKGKLPKGKDAEGKDTYTNYAGTTSLYTVPATAELQATYTSKTSAEDAARFVDKRIIHLLTDAKRADNTTVATDGAANAIYEMFTGDVAYNNAFLMHPTSAYIDTKDADFTSYYLLHDTGTNITKLVKESGRGLKTNSDANWSLRATADQLLPYFKRAGYVGGIDPAKAEANFTYQDYYSQLQNAVKNNTSLSFTTLRKIQEIVYSGTFKDNTGTTVAETDDRPTADKLPMTFESTNLVNMKQGYYRIRAFSEKPLDYDGNDLKGDNSKTVKGVIGPRYISGYRFESEKEDPNDTHNDGGRWLHFFETDMEHSTIHTFGDLKAQITASGNPDRDQFDHVAMRGNIEILPADFDPSSIFYFSDAGDAYNRYNIETQGLKLWARAGGYETVTETGLETPAAAAHTFGRTELSADDPTAREGNLIAFSDKFRLADIGGAAVTLRTHKYELNDHLDFDNAKRTLSTWDDIVAENLQTNYVCIDRNHRYRITCHTQNEMVEIGDHKDENGVSHGIQDTKWCLQPVGIHEEWPYNEMPLRVEVQQGGVKNHALTGEALTADSNKDQYFYGSLYVPFDTRLGNTTDAAFTLTQTVDKENWGTTTNPGKVTMSSVSRLNDMGNPQFVPALWPVVVRTSSDKSVVLKNQDESTYATRHYVNAYIPNATPTTVADALSEIKLSGQLLEKTLTSTDLGGADLNKTTIMAFGLPFEGGATHSSHNYDKTKQVGFFTNHNWMRGYGWGSIVGDSGDQPAANDGTAKASFLADARGATDEQRSNLYVYHNKIYYVLVDESSGSVKFNIALFDGDDGVQFEDEPIKETVTKKKGPWPCRVYDLQGRLIADYESPDTLLKNYPSLQPGVYIFGDRKVVVK